MLQLLVLPLEIAARHRDNVSLWDLPLAGQILGVAMIIGIAVPITFAPIMDLIFELVVGDSGVQLVALVLHLLSIAVLWPYLKKEYSKEKLEEEEVSRDSMIS